ncbi:hypothetical protein K3495_g8117 [Podosphaera aphanis]|nr:hypothetical protein K3495_g8117 [Podosphaera aphanis]
MGMFDWMDEIGRACDEFGKHQLAPAFDGIGKACHEFGEHQLAPAFDGIGKACHEFGEHQLAPAFDGIGKACHEFGEHQLAPAFDGIGKAIDKLDMHQFLNDDICKAFDQFGKYSLGDVVYTFLKFLAHSIDEASSIFSALERGLVKFTNWIEEHPIIMTLVKILVGSILPLSSPSIFTNIILLVLCNMIYIKRFLKCRCVSHLITK